MEYAHDLLFECPRCSRPVPLLLLLPEMWPDSELDLRTFTLRCPDPLCGWKGDLRGTRTVKRTLVQWPQRRPPGPTREMGPGMASARE